MYVCKYDCLCYIIMVFICRQFIPREEVHEVMRTLVAEVSAANTYMNALNCILLLLAYLYSLSFTYHCNLLFTFIHTYRTYIHTYIHNTYIHSGEVVEEQLRERIALQ